MVESYEVSKWISVKEQLPTQGQRVVWYNGTRAWLGTFLEDQFQNEQVSEHIDLVTHWMPSPTLTGLAARA